MAGQTALYGMSNIVGRLLNYFLVPLHTYIFTRAQYGTINEFYAYSSFLYILYTYGMETAYFRFASDPAQRLKVFDTGIISLIISSVLISGTLWVFAEPIAALAGYADQAYYIKWFALILSADALAALPFARLRLENKPLKYALLKLGNISLTIVLNLWFLLYLPKVGQTFGIQAHQTEGFVFLANLAASVLTALYFLPALIKWKYNFDWALLKNMLNYTWPLIVVGTAGMINETLDRVLLKIFLPLSHEEKLEQIGIYGACYKLSILMTLFVQAYRMAAEPFFFSEAKSSNSRETFSKMMSVFVAVCFIIFLGVAVNLDFIKGFIDVKFHEGLHIVPILLFANLCLGIYYNLSVWYKLSDKTLAGAYIAMIGAVITITLNVLLIPVYGYTGSAWATLACYFSMMLISYFAGQRYYPVPYNAQKISAYLAAAVIGYLLHQSFIQPLASAHIMAYGLANLVLLAIATSVIVKLELLPKRKP